MNGTHGQLWEDGNLIAECTAFQLKIAKNFEDKNRCGQMATDRKLISVKITGSMINSVAVYNDDYKRIATYKSAEGYAALYGLMEEAIKATKGEDAGKTAKQLLEDNGIKTTITAECIGNVKLITGNTVVVHADTRGLRDADHRGWRCDHDNR